ncbi:DsbA family protein [Pseudoroseicyclus tamaricis]|uniref:DsbA family protein n=1 Tax=Pseudoroseicyclus tamaricis TaxID=2705421 RepID=A0A6B2K206_9RHOB|nr:DsbA family protein [Pseudoroseicyclus tamaricis]NDV00446.1 DsbA family protein [Pseudoroseicyclus tamaricis]
MRRLHALLIAGTTALASPLAAQGLTDMTDEERSVFREEVRSYLLDNPEVLMEAIGVLEQREAEMAAMADQQLAAANADSLFSDGHSWVGGNPEGDITLVEFMDYRCGYCRQAFAEVEQLVETDGNIRFILKEFPILGEQSLLASQFAVAVKQLHGDDLYKEVHDALMVMRSDVTPDSLAQLAQTLGLEPGPVLDHMLSEEVETEIQANHDLASRLRINGTPTFVIEDEMLRGYVPLASMQGVVADLREEG